MRMPELLQSYSLTVRRRIEPESLQITLRADDPSTAVMRVRGAAEWVSVGDWIRIHAPNGEICVMYCKSKQTDYVNDQTTLNLESVFGLLDEMIMFGEVTPEAMGGGTKVTASAAISYILGRQTRQIFRMGGCDFSDQQGWKFTNATLRGALEDVREAIHGCQWEIDYTVFPFALRLAAFPTETTMEMRRNRNLESMQVTVDRSQMYTRVYPVGNKNLHIPGDYIDRNVSKWGVIAQSISDSTIEDADTLRAWADAQIRRNAEPTVSVSISGAELSAETGESLDRLRTGRLCRVPLPEYGITVTERLVQIGWKDAAMDETSVTVSLANEHKTIQNVMNQQQRSSGKRKAKADTDLGDDEERLVEIENSDIWINRENVWAVSALYDVINDEHGRHIRLKSGALLEVERESGVYQTVGDIIGDQDRSIENLDSWVDSFQGSALWTQRDNITGVCGEYDIEYYHDSAGRLKKRLKIKNGTGLVMERNGATYGIYDSGNLTAGVLVQRLNDGSTNLKLKADVIDIDGVVTKLQSKEIQCLGIDANTATFEDFVYSTQGFQTGATGTFSCSAGTFNVLDASIDTAGNLVITRQSGGTVTFSKATSLDGAWSGTYGPFRVTASPQGNTMPIYVEYVANGPSGFPIVRPTKTAGANLFVIDLDVGSLTGSGVNGTRTVSAKAGSNVAESQVITDYGDGYRDGRNASTITPTAINVYTAQQGTLLSTRLSASILTAGKYITMKVGSTTYSIQIT